MDIKNMKVQKYTKTGRLSPHRKTLDDVQALDSTKKEDKLRPYFSGTSRDWTILVGPTFIRG
jgi:hypothetical protein